MDECLSQMNMLDDNDGQLIRATETISTVSHCLRELIENSLDADAKILNIKINNTGLESLIVSDNGSGISRQDFEMLCREGATSKNANFNNSHNNDVNNSNNSEDSHSNSIHDDKNGNFMNNNNSNSSKIHHFSGGRGRALDAIANMSYMTIESSNDNSGGGYRLTFKNGEREIYPISRLKGTSVIVQSLFYAYPVRRHYFLQHRLTELFYLDEVVASFAMSTKANITVSIDGKTVTHVHASNKIQRISTVLGKDVANSLIHGTADLNEWCENATLEYFCTPLNANFNGRIYTSVNGRPVINMNIIRGVRNEFKSCNGNRWPVVILQITAKREMYEFTPDIPFIGIDFIKEDMLKALICLSLQKSWIDEQSPSSSPDITLHRIKPTRPLCLSGSVSKSKLTTQKLLERKDKLQNFVIDYGHSFNVIKQSSFANMEIIGQWNKAFVLTRLGPDIFAIDQHAACEAMNFEKLKKEKTKIKQQLVNHVTLNLTQEDLENAKNNHKKCQELGFDYDIIENGIIVKAVPNDKSVATGINDLQETLTLLREVPLSQPQTQGSRTQMAYRACHSSIRVGDTLSMPLMQNLLDRMATTEHPWNCPHGRPTWCCINSIESKFNPNDT
ncbi:mismatch repair protein [Tritrichomonas foetus]|uniref:Mismatch repair protein n=1 Tax=Tritrichomonas foetus TaxID=1144522 RepID=A0A1J4J5T8_9EUKA|nr:mismatch repair protein [Tritrichomonas foetus]|eukprot:OHS92821.1 mismatch repair protein [Tritrichomonas foetus]